MLYLNYSYHLFLRKSDISFGLLVNEPFTGQITIRNNISWKICTVPKSDISKLNDIQTFLNRLTGDEKDNFVISYEKLKAARVAIED